MRECIEVIAPAQRSASVAAFAERFDDYLATIGAGDRLLQGRDATLMHRIVGRAFLPEGARSPRRGLRGRGRRRTRWPGLRRAGHAPTARAVAPRHAFYLNDIADVLREAVDARFEFVRYAEQLATSQPSFDPLAAALAAPPKPDRPHAAGATPAASNGMRRHWC